MLHDALYALWFFLPAGAANVAPILATRLPLIKYWDAPLDCGLEYRGQRLLGASKTWRGMVFGIIFAVIVFMLQQKLTSHLGSFTVYLQKLRYTDISVFVGFLLGSGALIGDSVESFFKRRHGLQSGRSWFPFDQLDYILGGCLLAALVIKLPLHIYVLLVILWFVIHLVASYIGHLLHFKKYPI